MALTTPVGAVDLDHAGQEVAGVTLEHDLQELVLEAPGDVVGDTELALERKGRDGALLLRELLDTRLVCSAPTCDSKREPAESRG